MGWKKKFKKYAGKALGLASKVNPVIGAFTKSKEESGGEARSEAASQLVKKNKTQQAGGAQINFTTEEWT